MSIAENFDTDQVAQCAERIRRSILTLHVQPDGDARRLMGMEISWPDVMDERALIDQIMDRPRVRRFSPNARDISLYLDVLQWLMWLKKQNNGGRDFKVIWARAFGTPWWKLAQRFGRSERTVQRWYDGAVTRLWMEFWQDHFSV